MLDEVQQVLRKDFMVLLMVIYHNLVEPDDQWKQQCSFYVWEGLVLIQMVRYHLCIQKNLLVLIYDWVWIQIPATF